MTGDIKFPLTLEHLVNLSRIKNMFLYLSVFVSVDAPGWEYGTGFVDASMMKAHLPPPANDVLIVMCGPPPMIQNACLPNLTKLGYDPQNTFTY